MTHPADHPDVRIQLRHFRGENRALRFECERLEAEVANLRRKLQLQGNTTTGERVWSDAFDGRK